MNIALVDSKKHKRINKFIEWIIYMIGYALILISMSVIFKNTIQIDNKYYGIYALIASIIIYILNKTIKPVLVTLTIPITGITLGLFYPCINVFLLKLTDWILGPHFQITNLFVAIFAAVLLSITNFIMEEIIKTIINKVKTHE